MLVLYSQNETDFDSLGLGVLRDFKSDPQITEILNGLYNLEFIYINNGWLAESLIEGNIIKANGQLFRIRTVDKDIKKQTINILAKHIWFDLEINNWLEDVAPTDKKGHEALAWVLSHTQENNTFTVTGDCTDIRSARYVRMNPIEAIYNADNALLNRFGGELEINNFNITLHKKRGSDTGIEIRQKKNVTGASCSVDLSELATRIMPIGNDGLLLPEKYVDSPLINNYYAPFYYKLDVDVGVDEDNNITESDCYAAMRQAAQNLFNAGVDKPKVSISIDFVELSKTTEYKEYSNLETAHLGDTCRVYIPDLDMDVTVRIVETTTNCILNRVTKLVLGNPVPNYVSNNKKSENSIINAISNIDSTFLDKAREEATKIINHPFGGYILISKNTGELFIMDTDNPSTAQKVWKWGLGGLGYSSTGINGTYETAITANGKIVADFITAGTISTSVLDSDVITTSNLSAQTISANQITTGEIKSANYVANTSGTKLSLVDGTIDTKNLKVSSDGKISATDGSFSGTISSSNATITGGDITLKGDQSNSKLKVILNTDNTIYTEILPNWIRMIKSGVAGLQISYTLSKPAIQLSDGTDTTQVRSDQISTPKILAGNIDFGSCTLDSSSADVRVYFNKTFASVPKVFLTPYTSKTGVIAAKIKNVTTTYFEATIGGNIGQFTDVNYNWFAIG